jgi:hypothetical protein
MSYLAPLFTLQWRLLRNAYWRTRRQRFTTLLTIAGVAGLAIYLGHFLSDLFDPAWGWLAFVLIAVLIFLLALIASLASLIPHFYRSPDLAYLLALPIPANQILAVKFLAVQLQSSLGVLFISLTLLMAAGLSIAAPWYYYAALLPFFVVFTFVPAGISLLLGMALLRVMTAQAFSMLAGALSVATSLLGWLAVLVVSPEQLLPLLVRAAELLGWLSPLAELASPISAGQLLYALASAAPAQGLRPLLMLLLVTVTTMLIIFWVARYLFYQGWLVTQSAPASRPRQAVRPGGGAIQPPLIAALVAEWRCARRNKEAWFSFLMPLAIFVALIFFGLEGRILAWLEGSPEIVLVAVILGATTALPWGLATLFMPVNQIQQKGANLKALYGLLKRRLWLTKALPLTTAEVVLTEVLKVTAPTFLLGAAGILVFMLLGAAAPSHALLALIGLGLLLHGLWIVMTWLEYWGYGPGEKLSPVMVNLLQMLAPLVYLLAAAGPLTLYLLAGVIAGLAPLSQLLLLGGLLSWLLVSLLAIWLGWRLAVRSWEAMEID